MTRRIPFFVLIVGLGLGGVITTVALRWSSIEAGDIVSFFGALIGVGLAVFGAASIEDAKRKSDRNEELSWLLTALDRIEQARRLIATIGNDGQQDPASKLQNQALTVLSAKGSFDYVLPRVTIRSPNLQSDCDMISQFLAGNAPWLASRINPALNPPASDPAEDVKYLGDLLDIIMPTIDRARSAIRKDLGMSA